MNIKPIPFNTDMVCGLLADRKTVTRRALKGYALEHLELDTDGSIIGVYDQLEGYVRPIWDYAPYRPGDILYVRETFRIDYLSNIPGTGRVHYKADDTYCDFTFAPERYEMMRRAQLKPGWRPNENMPREAARIFLRVTDARVERLKNITEVDCAKEGICAWSKDGKLYKYYLADEEGDYPACTWQECPKTPQDAMRLIWNSTIKPADRALYGWDANPWVWAIEFERCEKPKGDGHGLQRVD